MNSLLYCSRTESLNQTCPICCPYVRRREIPLRRKRRVKRSLTSKIFERKVLFIFFWYESKKFECWKFEITIQLCFQLNHIIFFPSLSGKTGLKTTKREKNQCKPVIMQLQEISRQYVMHDGRSLILWVGGKGDYGTNLFWQLRWEGGGRGTKHKTPFYIVIGSMGILVWA